jgi:hypothetical protein
MGSVDNPDAALTAVANDWQAEVAAADQEERLRFRWAVCCWHVHRMSMGNTV